jgi:predicted transcriptional regulator
MAHEYTQDIRICPKCGFIFTANPFSEDILANRYKHFSKFEFDSQIEVIEENVSYKKRCLRQYFFIKNTINAIDSLLEVGSSSGFNLSLYLKDGVNVYGIEPSAKNVSSCRKKYGIEMFNGVFREYISSASIVRKYDMVFLSHVLEHIIDPYEFLLKLSDINNQYMFIEVPSFDYKFCDEPFGMFAEEHVNYFTFDSLRHLMETLGYHIMDANLYFSPDSDTPAGYPCISTVWEKNSVRGRTYSLTGNKIPVLSSRELLMKYLKQSEILDRKINNIIDRINDKMKLAVWGTGHHTSRLLGSSSLCRKNIVKFYDSDIRKNGMLYFNRNITPFNPEDIKNGEVESILVSTYVAQNAIVDMIKNSNINCNYVTLY